MRMGGLNPGVRRPRRGDKPREPDLSMYRPLAAARKYPFGFYGPDESGPESSWSMAGAFNTARNGR